MMTEWLLVGFQENAWCNQGMMSDWIDNCWKQSVSANTMLIADVHRTQTMKVVLASLNECNTFVVFVPAGMS